MVDGGSLIGRYYGLRWTAPYRRLPDQRTRLRRSRSLLK